MLRRGNDGLKQVLQMTIAQIVYDNERYFFSHDDIHHKVRSTLNILFAAIRRVELWRNAAHAHMVCHGRVYPERRLDDGNDFTGTIASSPKGTDALSTTHARVGIRISSLVTTRAYHSDTSP